MNTRKEKEKLQKYTIGYLIAMVVVFVVVLIWVRSPGLKTVALLATFIVFVSLIFRQWQKANVTNKHVTPSKPVEKTPAASETVKPSEVEQKPAPASPKKKVKEQTTTIKTKTGSVCTEPGEYHCSKHLHRTVVMDEGKRFPPCQGDNKGHSAIWVLTQE